MIRRDYICITSALGQGGANPSRTIGLTSPSLPRRHLRQPSGRPGAPRMVAAGPRLLCLCVGSPGSGAAAPLARHGRLRPEAVRAVDLASWPHGRQDPGGRWRRSAAYAVAGARDLAPPLLSCSTCRPAWLGRASFGRRFCTGGAAGGRDLVRAKSLARRADGDA